MTNKQVYPTLSLLFIFVFLSLIVVGGCSWLKSQPVPSTLDSTPSEEKSPAPLSRNTSEEIKLTAVSGENYSITLKWTLSNIKEEIRESNLYRSTTPLDSVELDTDLYPITIIPVEGNRFDDEEVADNSDYYYMLEIVTTEKTLYSPCVRVKNPDRELEELENPSIHIDKKNYILKVLDGDRIKKIYPVVLGRNPVKRKLHQDNSSTPEGIYKIINLQPEATYYKAYDINYPNDIDQIRYELAMEENLFPDETPVPDIGGEVQIHGGKNFQFNWTFGCISMRNEDIDQLFSHPEIKVGTPVIITGWELTLEDLNSIKKTRSEDRIKAIQERLQAEGFDTGGVDGVIGKNTRKDIGRFQKSRELPLTCEPDIRTLRELGIQED